MQHIFERILKTISMGQRSVLVTVVDNVGSTPRGRGSQMLVGQQGRLLGTIGGGAVEKHSEIMAQQMLAAQKSGMHTFELTENARQDIGMVCGGDMTVLFSYLSPADTQWKDVVRQTLCCFAEKRPAWLVLSAEGQAMLTDAEGARIAGILLPEQSIVFRQMLPIGERAVIFGAGHIAQALVPLLRMVNFRPIVYDNRPEYAQNAAFPAAEQVLTGSFDCIDSALMLTREDYIVIMTNGHQHDYEVELQALQAEHAYVGVIGSARKTAAVNERLRKAGIVPERLQQVHTPIGTKIHAVTPEEIAISIAGEMISVRALRRGEGEKALHACPMH